MTIMTRRLALLGLTSLAACGAQPRSVPPGPPGMLFRQRFDDADPVDFAAPKPAQFAVHGIDAARFQTSVNWNTARANGANFTFIKATEGGDLLDPAFKDHWHGAGSAGMWRAAYHFYYFCTAPEVQARWFIRNVPKRTGDLPPVLDMEWNPQSPTCAHLRPSAAEVQDQMRRWLAIVTAHYGQRPIIYTTPGFYEDANLRSFTGYDFWLRTTAKTPAEVYPGQPWRFWQYSATGLIDGIAGKVDLNTFNGNQEDWQAWAAARTIR